MGESEKSHIANDILARAHSPTTTSRIFRENVKTKPLLLRPSSPDPAVNARAKRQYARLVRASKNAFKRPKPLSAKQKRALCIYEIPKEQRKYPIYEGLHAMWCGYMREILGLNGERVVRVTAQSSGQLLASADYHGAEMEVVRSRCVSRVGLRGIVVKDTKFTFEIITRQNELKSARNAYELLAVPKEYTVFRFELPLPITAEDVKGPVTPPKPLVFELNGSQFENRAVDRANKKFKPHYNTDA
ncbi:hypothetical protein LTR28_004198 [Elasticomyces elasticus]|nr:hypothetical protein LTR28_004198 [Elasticomyces elasticus]